MDFKLLESLCSIPGISGDESRIKDFILAYVQHSKKNWKVQPKIIAGPELQDGFLLVFGAPRVAVFSHIDTVGYTVAYGNGLVKVGGPSAKSKSKLVDEKGRVCSLYKDKQGKLSYTGKHVYERGTCLSYQPDFKESEDVIQSPYLDNRLGVFVALKLAETLEDGILAFTTYEEVGGGNAQVLGRYIYDRHQVHQALVADITWVTTGVQPGNGVAISTRDSGIPRRNYVKQIIALAEASGVPYQLEVESGGGSDGNVLQSSAYPFDWCFIGAAEDHVHSPTETVSKVDISSMIALYKHLLFKL